MTFEKGVSPNPGGKVGGTFSDEALKLIASEYLASYTRGEIIELYEDKKRFDKLTTAHAMVITRIVASLEKEGRLDFDCVMDRLIGKAAQTSVVQVNVTDRRELIVTTLGSIDAILARTPNGRRVIDAVPVIGQASTTEA